MAGEADGLPSDSDGGFMEVESWTRPRDKRRKHGLMSVLKGSVTRGV